MLEWRTDDVSLESGFVVVIEIEAWGGNSNAGCFLRWLAFEEIVV